MNLGNKTIKRKRIVKPKNPDLLTYEETHQHIQKKRKTTQNVKEKVPLKLYDHGNSFEEDTHEYENGSQRSQNVHLDEEKLKTLRIVLHRLDMQTITQMINGVASVTN